MSRKPLPNPEYYMGQQPSPVVPPRRRGSQHTTSSSTRTPTIASYNEQDEAESNDILRFYKINDFESKAWHLHDYSATLSSAQAAVVAQKLNEPEEVNGFATDINANTGLKDPLDVYRSINPKAKKGYMGYTDHELNINHKDFDPKKFLHLIHSDTPKQDLIRGNEKLKYKMKEQSQSLRSLVKTNFDGFVGAKSTVDDVHEEMEEKGMIPETGYGTDKLLSFLDEAVDQANNVFGPIIHRSSKAEEIRNIMSLLERHRFFFDLPSTLISNMKQTKYDQIVKDYKRGNQLLRNIQQDSNSTSLNRLFEKIWSTTQSSMDKVRDNLFSKLDDPWMEMETQAKYIELLLQLDSPKDPLLYYIHNQHIWLADYIHRAFSEHTQVVTDVVSSSSNDVKSIIEDHKEFNLKHFHNFLASYGTDSFLTFLEESNESKIWRSTLDEVKLLLNVVAKTVPELHRFFIQLDKNEIRKTQFPGDMTWVQWHSMNHDVFEMLGLAIYRLFHPDEISQASAQILGNTPLPPLPVSSTNSYVIGHYISAIAVELNSAIQESRPITLKSESRSQLYDALIMCRTECITMYSEVWRNDVKYLFQSQEGVSNQLAKQFIDFQTFSLDCLSKIYNAVPVTMSIDPKAEEDKVFEIIVPTLIENILTFLSELRVYAFKETPQSQNSNNNSSVLVIDPEKGIRMLSALHYAVQTEKGLNQLFSHLSSKFNFSKTSDVTHIKQGFKKLKDELFDSYIRLKFTRIHRILERGIIKSEFPWGKDGVPTEIRPYVYDTLMCLVLVHAEITKISTEMLKRIMPHLSDLVSQDCLELFGKLKQFGMEGALQATLEIGFMKNTLKPYISKTSKTNYDKLIHWVQRAQYKSTSPPLDASNPKLHELGKLVAKSEKYTRGMFGCFGVGA